MNCKLTVVIPVYNREKFIVRCVESVLKQSGSETFQIILVDDGSTDGSPEICDSLQEKYPNVFAFHQKNAGVSAARNLGIEKADGEWISFVDSDDYLLDGFYEKLLDGETADLICCAYTGNGIESDKLCSAFENRIYQKHEFSDSLYPVMADGYSFFQCWNKIYKRSIVIENNLIFPVGVKYAEDMIFVYNYVKCIESFKFVNEKLYFYYISEGNTTNVVKKGYEAYRMIYIFLTDYFSVIGFNASNLKHIFTENTVSAIYTAACFLKFFKAYPYIKSILSDNLFFDAYSEIRNYQKCEGINKYLDRFIVNKKIIMIILLVKFNEIRSRIKGKRG